MGFEASVAPGLTETPNMDESSNFTDVLQESHDKVQGYDSEFYLNIFYEYEQGQSAPIVKDRMKAAYDFWVGINANTTVLDVICSGYKLPFFSTPPSNFLQNNQSALKNADFVSQAIEELLVNNLIVERLYIPTIVNPLSVSTQSSGKKRLILDLRYVNQFLWKEKITFDDTKVAMDYFQKGDFMISFDLKSGYHHINIFEEHSEYLSFAWSFQGNVRYFSFQVLPFGLSTAPYIFTKCLRPLVKHWRKKGISIVLYLDDGWVRASTYHECLSASKAVKADLLSAGLVPNKEKSTWIPTRKLDWLGISWDADEGTIKVTARRVMDILKCIDRILATLPRVTARRLASIAGKVISLIPVMGHISPDIYITK
jgi:hypothetical protein